MNDFIQRFADLRFLKTGVLIPTVPTATCQLCGDTVPISREEEAQICGYPPRPYVCPLCRHLMEEAEKSICQEILSALESEDLQNNHCTTNKTEVMNNERYDEKPEPDEASDDGCEELCREFEADHEGGGSKEGCCGYFQAEAEHPVRIHVELLITADISIC